MATWRPPIILLTVLLATPAAWGDRDQGPETLDLKAWFAAEGNMPAVIFTHRHHQQLLTCRECHLDPEGGGGLRFEIVRKISVRNDFHAKACWPCHRRMKVKGGTECVFCHGGKTSGEQAPPGSGLKAQSPGPRREMRHHWREEGP